MSGVRQVQDRGRGCGEAERQIVVGVVDVAPAAERQQVRTPPDGEAAEIVESVEQHRIEGRLQHDLRHAARIGDGLVGIER